MRPIPGAALQRAGRIYIYKSSRETRGSWELWGRRVPVSEQFLWRPARQQEMMDHTEQTNVSMKSALRSCGLPPVLAAPVVLNVGVATGYVVVPQFPADGAG